jgi:hypothetical protein
MKANYDIIDKAALALGGGLMLLGIVVLGILEILAGKPYGAAPVEQTNEAGEVINTLYPAVDPTLRTGLVIAGLVVLLIWGLYRMTGIPAEHEESQTVEAQAD